MTTKKLTPTRVLRNMLKRLETVGWCKGQFTDPSGKVCLLQALEDVTSGHSFFGDDLQIKTLNRLGFKGSNDVIRWNDRTRRRFKDVKDRILKALEA